jgi:hypothetical protein
MNLPRSVWIISAASSCRKRPSRPRVLARAVPWACGPHDARRVMSLASSRWALPWARLRPGRRVALWRVNEHGSYVFFVRVGSKLIEFEKGKNAVAVPSLDKMSLVINILITAVRNGELDRQLAQTKSAVLRYLKTA